MVKLQKGNKRVLRGGSWINNGRNVRSANRNANSPDNRNNNIGLRLAGALSPMQHYAGGSINQQFILSHNIIFFIAGQTLGCWRVSQLAQQCFTKALPHSRFIFNHQHKTRHDF